MRAPMVSETVAIVAAMADEKKGVTVWVTGTHSQHYERGTDVRVHDGHLFVTEGSALRPDNPVVAVYSPGHWSRLKVVV